MSNERGIKVRFVPLVNTLRNYRRENIAGDVIAGLIVTIMLVPQAMAYAMLAGLPPQVGLYASILPLILYALFGTSNTLAVGPVAMVSLLVVTGVGAIAPTGSSEFIALCLVLALLAGLIKVLMALFRLGFLVNFISHPVLGGFTTAAALVIGFSQLKHVLGVSAKGSEYPLITIWNLIQKVPESNWMPIVIGVVGCAFLVLFPRLIRQVGSMLKVEFSAFTVLGKTAPLLLVVITAVVVSILGLNETYSLAIVGEIPKGLPQLTVPNLDWNSLTRLFPLALVITVVGYLESISVAKALATRRRETVDANQELFALGAADIGAAFTGGYPVTGGFSRSLVNFAAGAQTPVASIITAFLVAVSVALLTPYFNYIPQATLAAIILVAVAGLVDFKTPFVLWRYSRHDAWAFTVTFFAVLGIGIENGILVGIVTTMALMMWRISRPHIAEIAKVKGLDIYRNVLRHETETNDELFAFRVDASLTFANSHFVEQFVRDAVARKKNLKVVVLSCSGMNDIDSTGLETLESIERDLHLLGIEFRLSDVKGPVLDRLQRAGVKGAIAPENVYRTTDQAMPNDDELANVDESPSAESVLVK
ncbi:MAG: sulfate permease [Pirellulaceae bacterium]